MPSLSLRKNCFDGQNKSWYSDYFVLSLNSIPNGEFVLVSNMTSLDLV